jgi:RHS repeat-associated protein
MVSPESGIKRNQIWCPRNQIWCPRNLSPESAGVTYTYDNNGNMITATTTSGTTTYTYDYENRLTNVDIHGTIVATYTYDALGRRIGIDDSGTQTWTVFNGKSADANPYADFTSSGTLKMRYLDGLAVDELLARTDASGNTSWYLTDQVGSVVAIASTSAVLDQITYDPFGNIVTQTDSAEADRFMFAGMEFDSNTGLYYDHARYYDAAIGRFVSQDQKGFAAGDANLYRYVGNEPTLSLDPSGEQEFPKIEYPNWHLYGPGDKGRSQIWWEYIDLLESFWDMQWAAELRPSYVPITTPDGRDALKLVPVPPWVPRARDVYQRKLIEFAPTLGDFPNGPSGGLIS